jgi:hypothetical protein
MQPLPVWVMALQIGIDGGKASDYISTFRFQLDRTWASNTVERSNYESAWAKVNSISGTTDTELSINDNRPRSRLSPSVEIPIWHLKSLTY